ncbi:molybdopterin biosynthesis protein [Methanocrinis sp.]|uniref:molybdopterin biosynthesis protein n=1 Tax=Methanocrinis sp. TaxID=3101522 RepID=UPI003D12AA56
MQKEFHTLLSLDEAKKIVLASAPRAGQEIVPLERGFGRVLDERVVSGVDVPGFDRAAMDGYALRSKETLEAREDRPVAFNLIGTVPMGKRPELVVGEREAAGVSTGSMMPQGADAVVMVEHTEVEGSTLLIRRAVHVGENVHRAGGDVALGETVLLPGRKLSAREIGLLAAVGRKEVRVRFLRVAVASSGDELVPPGRNLSPGQIYDINSCSIAAAVEECGGSPIFFGILPDDHDYMAEGLLAMAEESDLVLVSGSTSAGIGDMVYRVVEELGEIAFHGINLKPGKPTLFGTIGGTPFIGLPGYPTSALTVFGQLAAPAIRKAVGTEHLAPKVRGRLAKPVRSEGRRQMLTVAIAGGWVRPVDKGSGSITTLAMADGVVEIPDRVEHLDQGDEVEVQLFGSVPEPPLLLEGEDCPRLELLAAALPFEVRVVSTGSRRGAISAKDGVADVAVVSRSEGSEPVVDERGLEPVGGYRRDLVIMAKDPELLDFERIEDLRVLSWTRDSEMSRVLRRVLEEAGCPSVEFVGQARSHSAIAASVKAGRADLGFGVREAAEEANLASRRVATDEIVFLADPVKKDREAVRAFVEALQSEDIRGGAISTNWRKNKYQNR